MTTASRRSVGLPIKALYTIAEIQVALGLSRYRTQKLLADSNVVVLGAGRLVYIPIQEMQTKLPAIWDAMTQAARTLRNG